MYRYSFHRPKLEFVRESDEHRRFAPVANFLEAIPLICPHDLFRAEDAGGRASQAQPAFADVSRIIVNRKENAATRAAALVIPTVGNNRERHERLQQFMLANDSVTLAVEVPIWITEEDIAALEEKYGIELVPRSGTSIASSPGTWIFCRCATVRCTSWITSRTRAPTSRSRSSRSTRSRSRAWCRVSRSSTSSARGSTRTSIASSFRARCLHRKEGDG